MEPLLTLSQSEGMKLHPTPSQSEGMKPLPALTLNLSGLGKRFPAPGQAQRGRNRSPLAWSVRLLTDTSPVPPGKK